MAGHLWLPEGAESDSPSVKPCRLRDTPPDPDACIQQRLSDRFAFPTCQHERGYGSAGMAAMGWGVQTEGPLEQEAHRKPTGCTARQKVETMGVLAATQDRPSVPAGF